MPTSSQVKVPKDLEPGPQIQLSVAPIGGVLRPS